MEKLNKVRVENIKFLNIIKNMNKQGIVGFKNIVLLIDVKKNCYIKYIKIMRTNKI